jgi:hypothetical protein
MYQDVGVNLQEGWPYLPFERFIDLWVTNKSAVFIDMTKVDCADRQSYEME